MNNNHTGISSPDVSTTHSNKSPLSTASCWSKFWFSWNLPLLKLGLQRPLLPHDLPPIDSVDSSRSTRHVIQNVWCHEQQKQQASPSLALALFQHYFRTTWSSRFLIVVNSLVKIGQACALGALLEQFDDKSNDTAVRSYLWATVMILCGLVAFPTKQHSFFQCYRTGNQYRAGLTAALYTKTLRLSSCNNISPGHVTNLASNDVERFVLTSIYANLLLASPVELCVILGVGLWTMGSVFLYGYAILLVVLVPLQIWLSRRFVYFRGHIAKQTDARVGFVAQAVQGARVWKLQGWQQACEQQIVQWRDGEVVQLQTSSRLKAYNDAIYYVSSLVVAVCVLGIYVAGGTALTPRIVYTSFTLLNLLQYTVTKHIPNAVLGLSECYVACRRIQAFLELPEQQSNLSVVVSSNGLDRAHNEEENAALGALLELENVASSWRVTPGSDKLDTNVEHEQSIALALQNISLNFCPGKLYCIIGKVGSGKSALLQALIGELAVSTGTLTRNSTSMAYSAQDPWIMNGTVRENIVMGLAWDESWYKLVVKASGLQDDLEYSLQDGDQTIVGDQGIQCSGGQRARISLARTLYCDAQILVLDDPLSAVDSKVARTIFYSAIQELGVKRGKCVILVTHQIQFAGFGATTCILMDKGRVLCAGSMSECIKASNGGLSDVLQTEQEDATKSKDCADKENTERYASTENDLSSFERRQNDSQRMDQSEKRTTGVVQRRTWVEYGKSLGGPFICALFFLFFAGVQAAFLYTFALVGKWAEAPPEEQDSSYWFTWIYSLTFGLILISIVRAQLSFHLFLEASKRLHNKMLHSVLHARIEFFDTNPMGRILNRFSADVGISDETLPLTVYDFSVAAILFIGSIITTIVVLPFTLVVFPLLLLLFLRLKRMFVSTTRELKRLEGLGRSPIYAMMSESLVGIATIRCNDKVQYFRDTFEQCHDHFIQAQFAFISCSRWFALKLDILSFVFMATATLSSVLFHQQGWVDLDPAILGLALTLLLQLSTSNFPYMIRQSAEVTNHMISIERVLEFGNDVPQEAPLVLPFDKDKPDWPEDSSIVVDNLTARYRKDLPPCLSNVTFSVKSGQRVGVVGRTGSGKSSLLQALFRILEAEEGTITIGGVDISKLGLHKLRTSMAVITQSPVLFSSCSIRQNLDPFGVYSDKALEEALRSVHMWETIQESMLEGLDTLVAENGSNFSMGQQQLLCLARACLTNAKIVVLDEPSANVDLRTDQLLQQALRERFAAATIISIAHRLDTVMEYDTILVLVGGAGTRVWSSTRSTWT